MEEIDAKYERANLKAGMASPLSVASWSSEWVRSLMRSMGLCCGCALVESRLSAGPPPPPPPPSAATVEEAEWWRGRRCRMESAGGDDGDEEGGEWAAWPLEIGDGWGDREERRRAGEEGAEKPRGHCYCLLLLCWRCGHVLFEIHSVLGNMNFT